MNHQITAAMPRSEAIRKTNALAEPIIFHLAKISLYPNSVSVNHWANEVSGWIRKCYYYLTHMKSSKYSRDLDVASVFNYFLTPSSTTPSSKTWCFWNTWPTTHMDTKSPLAKCPKNESKRRSTKPSTM